MTHFVIAHTCWQRLRGLKRLPPTYQGTLMLIPCHDIHTFGMKKPIDVAFLNPQGIVIKAQRNVAPQRRLACPHALCVLERFAQPHTPWLIPGQSLFNDSVVNPRS